MGSEILAKSLDCISYSAVFRHRLSFLGSRGSLLGGIFVLYILPCLDRKGTIDDAPLTGQHRVYVDVVAARAGHFLCLLDDLAHFRDGVAVAQVDPACSKSVHTIMRKTRKGWEIRNMHAKLVFILLQDFPGWGGEQKGWEEGKGAERGREKVNEIGGGEIERKDECVKANESEMK